MNNVQQTWGGEGGVQRGGRLEGKMFKGGVEGVDGAKSGWKHFDNNYCKDDTFSILTSMIMARMITAMININRIEDKKDRDKRRDVNSSGREGRHRRRPRCHRVPHGAKCHSRRQGIPQ